MFLGDRENVKASVVIASYNARSTIEKCLESLEHQRGPGVSEVIVIDSSTDGTAEIVAQRFPWVRLLSFLERKFPGDARNFGVSQSKSELLAFIDADCIADPHWIDEIVKAHQSQSLVIGGAIDNGDPKSYVGWAYYFCEFSQWMPGLPKGQANEIPTCCLSLTREAFDKYGPFLERIYSSDTAFHWKLGRDGHKPLFNPAIKVSHLYADSLTRFLRHETFHGKSFAKVRVREKKLSCLQRIFFMMRSLYLPFLQLGLTAQRVVRDGSYLKQFALSSPLAFLGMLAWSWGEFLGYWSKPEK